MPGIEIKGRSARANYRHGGRIKKSMGGGLYEKLVERVDGMMHNQVNIERLEKDMEKAQRDVEKLKDNLRNFANGNGH